MKLFWIALTFLVIGCERPHLPGTNAQNTGWEEGEPVTKPTQRWTQAFDTPLRGTPCVDGDVFVSTRAAAYRLDRATGKEVWKQQIEGIATSPTIFDDRVVVATVKGRVIALDQENGEVTWELDVGSAVVARPTVADNLFVPTYRGEVIGVSDDGLMAWKARTAAAVVDSPAVDRTSLAIASTDGFLYVLNRVTGELQWKWEAPRALTSAPLMTDKLVVLGVPDGSVLAFERVTGKVLWSNPLRSAVVATPIATPNLVIAATVDGQIRAFDRVTGTTKWSIEDPQTSWSSMIGRGDTLIHASVNKIRAFEASNGKVLWELDTKGLSKFSPLLSEDLMVVIEGDSVAAYSLPKP